MSVGIYKVWIACSTDGVMGIGAEYKNYWKKKGELADCAKVYGTQIPHRCVSVGAHPNAVDYMIMTPTQAKKEGRRIVGRF